MNGNEAVTFGNGIKIWLIFCIVVSIPSAFSNILLGNLAMGLVGFILVAAHIWLLAARQRKAFFLICAFAVVIFIINTVVYRIGIIFSVFGFLNPAITYAFLRPYWNNMQ